MKVLSPYSIKNVHFSNRVVMAPMVPFGLEAHQGIMSEELLEYYFMRIKTGIGLVISQAIPVTASKELKGRAGAYDKSHIDYLRRLVEACHANGSRFFVQLSYPSTGYGKGDSITRFSKDDLAVIRDEFINAAAICKTAGCDGVELHGAHTYFLNMLSSPVSNSRTDEFGGSLENRMALACEMILAIKAIADDKFIVSYRLGVTGDTDLDAGTAQLLESCGLDLLHVSWGIGLENPSQSADGLPFNQTALSAGKLKQALKIPVISVSDIRSLERGNFLVEKDFCDFAAYGRPFLADAEFMKHSVENPVYESCLRCKKCLCFIDIKTCTACNRKAE